MIELIPDLFHMLPRTGLSLLDLEGSSNPRYVDALSFVVDKTNRCLSWALKFKS